MRGYVKEHHYKGLTETSARRALENAHQKLLSCLDNGVLPLQRARTATDRRRLNNAGPQVHHCAVDIDNALQQHVPSSIMDNDSDEDAEDSSDDSSSEYSPSPSPLRLPTSNLAGTRRRYTTTRRIQPDNLNGQVIRRRKRGSRMLDGLGVCFGRRVVVRGSRRDRSEEGRRDPRWHSSFR